MISDSSVVNRKAKGAHEASVRNTESDLQRRSASKKRSEQTTFGCAKENGSRGSRFPFEFALTDQPSVLSPSASGTSAPPPVSEPASLVPRSVAGLVSGVLASGVSVVSVAESPQPTAANVRPRTATKVNDRPILERSLMGFSFFWLNLSLVTGPFPQPGAKCYGTGSPGSTDTSVECDLARREDRMIWLYGLCWGLGQGCHDG